MFLNKIKVKTFNNKYSKVLFRQTRTCPPTTRPVADPIKLLFFANEEFMDCECGSYKELGGGKYLKKLQISIFFKSCPV